MAVSQTMRNVDAGDDSRAVSHVAEVSSFYREPTQPWKCQQWDRELVGSPLPKTSFVQLPRRGKPRARDSGLRCATGKLEFLGLACDGGMIAASWAKGGPNVNNYLKILYLMITQREAASMPEGWGLRHRGQGGPMMIFIHVAQSRRTYCGRFKRKGL